MQVDLTLVRQLRVRFKAGVTVSALVRAIAERHQGAAFIDTVVRAYFREAFHIPMLLIGPEQVAQIVCGDELQVFNDRIRHRIIDNEPAWDTPLDAAEIAQARAG